MKKKVNILSFFAAMFLTFGITSLNFDDLQFDENIKGYFATIIGLVLAIAFFILKSRENKLN
ncbi:MAG: hypothetical protein JKY48_17560 [Flavobacteriales bacterium]|nr:hypothetical protein [Flavobacteriales bacterium]